MTGVTRSNEPVEDYPLNLQLETTLLYTAL